MPFLYLLEDLRTPVLDAIFSLVTLCGEETIFMAIGMLMFWCVNKYEGYYLLSVGFVGTLINQFLKMLCRVPRPWVKDPSFTIVESAREGATGYSFPSGHTQCSVGFFGGIARWTKHGIFRIVAIVLCVLVPLSRMYLGVHTPADVLVSVAVALTLVFVAAPLFQRAAHSPKLMYGIFFGIVALTTAYLLFVTLYHFPDSVYLPENLHNLESARKNGYTMMGCALGLICIYTVDERWIHFETKAVLWAQVLKTVIGLALVLAVKELLRFPIDAILDANTWGRMLRYFLMVIVGGLLWPMTFRYFAKLGNPKQKHKGVE